MMHKKLIRIIFTSLLFFGCSSTDQTNPTTINSNEHLNAPYLLLISIDGYRYDYTSLYRPPNIKKMITRGSWARSLKPVFPSQTYTSHYSIITGLHPGNHGIIDNHFFIPETGKHFSLRDKNSIRDGKLYGGTPLWVLAENQGMLSASNFWPASQTKIKEILPSYHLKNSIIKKITYQERIDQIIKWLKLPKKNRPHFITLYFPDVNSAGYYFGPESIEVGKAVKRVDDVIGKLFQKIDELQLKINIVLLSPHGMMESRPSSLIHMDEYFETKSEEELSNNFEIMGYGATVHLYHKAENKRADCEKMIHFLNRPGRPLTAYLKNNIPSQYKFQNSRVGDILIIAKKGYSIGLKNRLPRSNGIYGYGANVREMHGIFHAFGPNIRKGIIIDSVDSVHIYPFISKILGLKIKGKIDGDRNYLDVLIKR